MTEFEKFIKELHDAGWSANADARYTGIAILWEKLFPDKREIDVLNAQINELLDREAEENIYSSGNPELDHGVRVDLPK